MGAILTRSQYGWKPDDSDERDYKFAAPRLKLPKSMDLRESCPAIKNQTTLGACVGHGVGFCLEYLYPSRPNYSRLFIYYNARAMEGTTDEDAGAQIRNGVKSVAKLGACRESILPYNIAKFAKKPSVATYKDAQKTKLGSYNRITSLNGLKAALADHLPVVFGFMVYEDFESEEVAKTGTLPMPKAHQEALGGHCVVAVGFDDRSKRVIAANSWGRSWGQKGYFTLPYDFIADKSQCDDFWVMRKAA